MQWAQHQLYVLNVWHYVTGLNAEEGRSQTQKRARTGAERTWNDLNHDRWHPIGYRALTGWWRDEETFNKAVHKYIHNIFLYMDGYITILPSDSWGWSLFPPDGQEHWEQHYCSQTEELLPAQALSKPSEHPENGHLHHVLCNYRGTHTYCQAHVATSLYFIHSLLNNSSFTHM